MAESGISENIPRAELEALLCGAGSHQQCRWTEGFQLYATTLDVPSFSSSLKKDIFLPFWGTSPGGGESLWLRETSFLNRLVQITPQGLPTLSQRNHMKSRQENKRWLNTCHSKEETQNLYPWVYLVVPDTVDIRRDQLARRSWRNPLRIATGSNQTDFRGPRHNPQLAKVDRQSCLRTPWQKPIKMTCKRQKTDKRKASSFAGMKATYYHHEHGRFQVQEGLLWLQSTLISMILHTRHQPRALDRLQKRVFNYLFRKLSKQGKEQ